VPWIEIKKQVSTTKTPKALACWFERLKTNHDKEYKKGRERCRMDGCGLIKAGHICKFDRSKPENKPRGDDRAWKKLFTQYDEIVEGKLREGLAEGAPTPPCTVGEANDILAMHLNLEGQELGLGSRFLPYGNAIGPEKRARMKAAVKKGEVRDAAQLLGALRAAGSPNSTGSP
jgi:hypothetical protein